MLYLSVDRSRIRLLYLKKTLLGQYENAFYEKKHSVDLLDENGNATNTDLIASAIKEATSSIIPGGVKDKDVSIILPQASFQFFRTEVPADIAPSAVDSFIKDKARANIQKDLDGYLFDYLVQENEKQKQIIFFAVDKEVLSRYQEACSLVDLRIVSIIPEALSYFKLFEKTLRKDKKENILYIVYDKGQITGHLYDSYGPLSDKEWKEEVTEKTNVEDLLKNKITEYEKEGKKINRLILAGENSEQVRQDTFTKNVGVWTNPLKRIIPHFYQDYLKIFIMPADKTLPLLQYDVCIGAFIFSLDNKNFSLLKKKFAGFSTPKISAPKVGLPLKEILIFIISFGLSLAVFIAVSRLNTSDTVKKINFFAKPTATPTPVPPTPTPTVTVNKAEVKIKVLNGSGVRGKASEVKDVLNEAGYEEILTGNADNFDYTTTEIQVKKGKSSLANTLKEDLKDSVSAPKITTDLDEEDTADIILIFGSDFK